MPQLLGEQYFIARDRNGLQIEGAKAYFFLTETSTLANVFSDADLQNALEQPVLSDSAGRFDPIYLDPQVTYKMRVYDQNDVEIEPSPYDPLTNFSSFFDPDATPIVEGWVTAISDPVTPITTGPAKRTWRMPYAFTVTAVRACLQIAQASGSIFTVDILKNGVSILSTLITIDNTEKTSVTAATPAVISVPTIADDAELSFSVTQVGNGSAVECHVTFIGHRT